MDERRVSPDDERFMARALELARRGLGLASPNPMVGAVVVSDGEVLGEGWHEGPGTDHAEVIALRRAGERARDATLYVTLEPCSHQGRTPPCAPQVIGAAVARVVVATGDPNPVVDGRGLATLRDAGVAVDVGVAREEGRRLIEAFAKAVTTGVPFVTLKMAASLDGRVAARDGSSRWITGPEARRDVHVLRAGADAVLVGAGTALADDPALTVRLEGYGGRQPLRVVADASGRVPAGGRLFDATGGRPVLATTERAAAAVRGAWEERGGAVHVLPTDGSRGVSLPALLQTLRACHGTQGVLIEGGPTLAWSAVRDGVVDRVVWYVAPKLLGGDGDGFGSLMGEGVATIADALPLDIEAVERLGADLRVSARPAEARI